MKENKIRFSWDIHWSCNYRCPYCWWHGRWEELGRRNHYPGRDKLISVWKNIYEKKGEVNIEISGGEPFIYPDFSRFINEILKYHTVSIMTNLSKDIEGVINDKFIHRIKIGATFHPGFADFDEFIAKATQLKQKDFSIGVLYLAYPPQVGDIPYYRNRFLKKEINFYVSTFWGEYNGKQYPDSYTSEELKIITPALGKRKGKKFQTKPFETKGKLCNAGHTYGIIHPDGEVLPCGGGSWKGENIIIGNIFDEDFKLWNQPHICHSDYCPCNEWAFLLREK